MKTSEGTLKKIKEFEGCRLKAYKPVAAEKYWTIGVGHYGPDVSAGMTITEAQAMELLKHDVKKYEDYVTATGLVLNQNQFDALVSFTFNCGPGNLAKLIKGRDYKQIADAMLLYNKGANKQVLKGLVRRREWERNLFLTGFSSKPKAEAPKGYNPFPVPKVTLRNGSTGQGVKWLQVELDNLGYHLNIDGIFGPKTEAAVKEYQKKQGLVVDGIVGARTRGELTAGR